MSTPRDAIIAAARFWRATQIQDAASFPAIDYAQRCLQQAIDAYEAELEQQRAARPADDCACANGTGDA